MQQKRSVLVVDDDPSMQESLCAILEEACIDGTAASSAAEATDLIKDGDFAAVISDIRMPGKDGFELLGELRETRPDVPVILMTAFGGIDAAVEAMRLGAFHYITKPFKQKEVLVILSRAFEHRALEEENKRLRRAVSQSSSCGDLYGESAAMHEIFALIRKISNSRSTVLITGESGTGKEVVARAIHFTGERASRAFVPVNCAAIPDNLLESELFGHVRGAFTGAHAAKPGLFEEAEGGTLFLDEIGDITPSMQVKLLRVLQDGEIRRVGSTRSTHTDVRLIAATNRNLRKHMDEGKFREDLYYRLNVIPVHIPPLRDRRDDIRVLAEVFLRKHATDPHQRLSLEGLAKLETSPWRGNVRELENAIERAIALSDRMEISADAFPFLEEDDLPSEQPQSNLLDRALEKGMKLQELEDRYIAETLNRTGGNKMKTAKILGIDRRTLYRRYEDINPYLKDPGIKSGDTPSANRTDPTEES